MDGKLSIDGRPISGRDLNCLWNWLFFLYTFFRRPFQFFIEQKKIEMFHFKIFLIHISNRIKKGFKSYFRISTDKFSFSCLKPIILYVAHVSFDIYKCDYMSWALSECGRNEWYGRGRLIYEIRNRSFNSLIHLFNNTNQIMHSTWQTVRAWVVTKDTRCRRIASGVMQHCRWKIHKNNVYA